jgi:hypothetical protein
MGERSLMALFLVALCFGLAGVLSGCGGGDGGASEERVAPVSGTFQGKRWRDTAYGPNYDFVAPFDAAFAGCKARAAQSWGVTCQSVRKYRCTAGVACQYVYTFRNPDGSLTDYWSGNESSISEPFVRGDAGPGCTQREFANGWVHKVCLVGAGYTGEGRSYVTFVTEVVNGPAGIENYGSVQCFPPMAGFVNAPCKEFNAEGQQVPGPAAQWAEWLDGEGLREPNPLILPTDWTIEDFIPLDQA